MSGSMRDFNRRVCKETPRRGLWMTSRALVVVAFAVLASACDETRIRDTLPPGMRLDTFQQSTVSKVDVLVVVDNSASMVEEQENLGKNFDRFLSFLTDASVDFRIGVTTTDIVNDKGRLVNAPGHPSIITPETKDPLASFSANVRVDSTIGSALEAGLEAARRTFELKHEGFLRPDAWLFIIFVSDEEDDSFGEPKYFYRYFSQLKGKGNEAMVRVGAIVGDVPGGCFSEQGDAEAGERYAEVVRLMGGRLGSICDPEFDEILREMGIDAVGLKRKFQLSKVPDLSTLEVKVMLGCNVTREFTDAICGSTVDDCGAGGGLRCTARELGVGKDGWTYETATNSVVFHGRSIPSKGSVIELMYFEPGER